MRSAHLLDTLFLCVLSISYAAVPTSKDLVLFDQCTTPDNYTGLCVKIHDCQHAIDLLLRRNLSQAVTRYLRLSQCGFSGSEVVICCANMTLPGNILLDAEECIPKLENRIYGGSSTDLNEFPWMALISYKKPYDLRGFHCVGSLISSRYILTAAHCVDKMPSEWIIESVRLGEHNLETNPDCIVINEEKTCAPPPLDIGIESTLVHPKYNASSKNQYNDIALLRTIEPVTYSEFIRPICLPIDELWRHNPFTNSSIEVAGWGQTENSSFSAPKIKTRMTIWDITQCEEKFQPLDINIKGTYHLCAGGKVGVDTCRGDSGGPLMVTSQAKQRGYYFMGGIVSFGVSQCGLSGWPGVYTRVGQHIEWIQQNIVA